MRNPRSVIYLCALSVVMCLVLAGLLLWTGQRVQDAEERIQAKNQNLLYEQERLRVLRAEWSHLNSPERLDKLMRDYRAAQDKNTAPHASAPRPSYPSTPANSSDQEGGVYE